MSMIPIGIGWLAGMWAAFTFELPTEPLLITVGIPLIAVVLWRDSPRTRLLLIALLAFLLGALRVTTARPVFDANDLATYNDQGVVTVTGVVDDYPDQRDQSVNLRIRAETLERRVSGESADAMMIEGMLLVRAPRLPEYRYGDRIEIRGTLQTPPEFATFSYRDYLAGQGIHSIIDQPRIDLLEHDQGSPILAAIFDLKDRAHDTIAHILPEPQASLLTGIMLGEDRKSQSHFL